MAEEVKVPILVVKSVEGKIEEVNVYDDKSIVDVVKEYARRALEEWNPLLSDLTVMKTKYELRYKLPIDPDLYDKAVALNLELAREGNEVVIMLPVYTISYDNRWFGDTYRDLRIYVVTYLLDENTKNQIVEYAKETTAQEKKLSTEPALELTPEQLQRLEEGLSEAEEVETSESKSRRRRRRSRRKSTSS